MNRIYEENIEIEAYLPYETQQPALFRICFLPAEWIDGKYRLPMRITLQNSYGKEIVIASDYLYAGCGARNDAGIVWDAIVVDEQADHTPPYMVLLEKETREGYIEIEEESPAGCYFLCYTDRLGRRRQIRPAAWSREE